MPQKWLRSNVCSWRDEMPKMTYEGWTRLFLLHLFNISVTFYSIFNPCPLPAIISPIFALELEVAPFLFFVIPCSSVYNRLPSSFLLFFTLFISAPLNLRLSCSASHAPDMLPHTMCVCLHAFTCTAHTETLQAAQSAEPRCIMKRKREAAK